MSASKWIVGIDEAGYGPNLGPFVMSAVACRVEGAGPACLWERLKAGVRRAGGRKRDDPRLVVDDSKLVHGGGKGIAGLERGIRALLGGLPATLAGLAAALCPADAQELAGEAWFTGTTALPACAGDDAPLGGALRAAGVSEWMAASAVVCPPRFNRVVDRAGTKSAILADSFVRLLEEMAGRCQGADIEAAVDKQGGRNSYAMQVQQATGTLVRVVEEGEARSRYEADLPGRRLGVAFLPRADSEHLCVALASMASKYLRELFMGEFNRLLARPGARPAADGGLPRRRPALPAGDPPRRRGVEPPHRFDLEIAIARLRHGTRLRWSAPRRRMPRANP